MGHRPLLWKLGLIAVVIAIGALFTYPPGERINLGLDLRGGAHILMQVETGSALTYQLALTQSRLGQALEAEGLSYGSIVLSGETAVEVRGVDPAASDRVREVLARWSDWDLSASGDGFVLRMTPELRAGVESDAIRTTLTTLRNRVDALGVAENLVASQGMAGDRILIQLPGVEDPGRVKEILQETDQLEWKAITYPPGATPDNWGPAPTREALAAMFGGVAPEDTELLPQRVAQVNGEDVEYWWPVKRVSTVVGSDLRSAFRDADQWGEPAVGFELTQDAGRRFEAATRENLGRHMAIVLGNTTSKRVISAPIIEGVIRDRGIIQGGGFTIDRAEDLALQLRSGAIPANIRIIEERTVGPSLGRDSIRAGVSAGIAGLLGVALFMLVYYRLSGMNAVVALSLNVLLTLGTLGALPWLFSGVQATLTLPGIAGLILTVGMAVDSNVLIFERIREELGLGKTVRSAIDQGFAKAFTTILDCNVTTLVSAFFLFSYGTGPVKGFAVTLTIGLLISMFTAVFVSRQLFEIVLVARRGAETLNI